MRIKGKPDDEIVELKKITLPNSNMFLICEPQFVADQIDFAMADDDSLKQSDFKVEPIKMTVGEYNALPEFESFC